MTLKVEVQVVTGLSYIHQELAIAHGKLSCSTILLDSSGRIKLGNFYAETSYLAHCFQRISVKPSLMAEPSTKKANAMTFVALEA